jgi:UDP-2,4-diacetamido-2,4,6-trideoxy-beta-L-altropyranose hydrolase
MKIGFRTDASLQIGSGHVSRCLALANGFAHLECVFICREHEGNLIENIRQEGFICLALPLLESESQTRYVGETSLVHSDWLGATQIEDAEQTIDLLSFEKLDWLIVDHYAIDELWEKKLRSCAHKIMVIDDLSDRRHDCDVILDQNLVANFETRYRGLVPGFCAQLMGPSYALLQPEYNDLRRSTSPRTGKINRILVSFGATDQLELTMKIVRAFQSLGRPYIRLDIVAPQYERLGSLIAEEALKSSNIFVYSKLSSLAHLMQKADLAIGACGITAWERCCLGLPSLVITLAKNQEPIAAELHRRGLVQWLGRHNEISHQILSDSLRIALDEISLEDWSKACMSVTDGSGVRRIASVMGLNTEAN